MGGTEIGCSLDWLIILETKAILLLAKSNGYFVLCMGWHTSAAGSPPALEAINIPLTQSSKPFFFACSSFIEISHQLCSLLLYSRVLPLIIE